jgi:hypothetical protein
MADNVQITPGAGTIIRAVDIGGVEYQVLILADAAGNLVGSTLGNNGRGANVTVLNDVPSVGIDADDAVMQTVNYPVYVGGRVRLGTAILPQAADGDAGGLTLTGDRRLVTAPIGCPEDQGATTSISLAQDSNVHTLIAAQASPVKIALWGFELASFASVRTRLSLFSGVTEIGCIGIGSGDKTVAWPAPIKTDAAVALSYQFAANPTGAVYLTPFWYKTRA